MKTHSKKNTAIVTTLLLVGVTFPVFSFANEAKTTLSCEERVSNFNILLQKTITEKETSYESKKSEQLKTILENRVARDQKTTTTWKKNDAEQKKKFDALKKNATTTESKVAIDTFETQIKEAVEKRRVATQDAFALSRKSVDTILNTRKENLENQKNIFKDNMSAMVASAKMDCQKGISVKTIEATIRNKITTEKNNFKKDLTTKNSTINIQTVGTTRKTQLEKAQAEFTKTTQTAKEDITDALKNK